MKAKIAVITAAVLTTSACAVNAVEHVDTAPPSAPYLAVSDLVALPDFIPGLGSLYTDPETLPVGPFLAYDREGNLSATVYMTPIQRLRDGVAYDNLELGLSTVNSVDIYYNAGHPGVEEPHAHVVLFHDDEAKSRLEDTDQLTSVDTVLPDSVLGIPPGGDFAQVSNLVELPEFLPGLGALHVAPETLPAGPFLGYDREGELATTTYMTPLGDLAEGAAYNDLAVGSDQVNSVDIYFNAGHSGVEEPHAHIVLFHGDDAKQRVVE